MNVGDAVKRVKDRSHRGDVNITTDNITDQIVRTINDARREVVRKVPKEWLRKAGTLSVIGGTTVYSLASDVQTPILFRYTSASIERFIELVESEREFYLNVYNASAAAGRPLYYTKLGPDGSGNKQIQIFPTPNASYTVTYPYYKDPTGTDLTTLDFNTEIPDVPKWMHDCVWKGALYYFLKSFDDPAQEIAKQDYDQSLAELDASNIERDSKAFQGNDVSDINDSKRTTQAR